MTALAQPQLDDSDLPALVVLGRDDTNKAHAAWFDGTEAEAATAAAKLMGMMALPLTNDEVRALADRLPHGKIFGSGKAFVPFTKQALFDALIAHVPVAEQVRPLRLVKAESEGDALVPPEPALTKPSTKNRAEAVTMPTDWTNIIPGSVVLITEDRMEGWFEAVVVSSKPNDSFECRWLHYPDLPNVLRQRVHLALLHPAGSPQG